MKNRRKLFVLFFIICFFISLNNLKAGTCAVTVEGPSEVVQNKKIDVTVSITNILNSASGITSFSGTYNLSNSNATVDKLSSLSGKGVTATDNGFTWTPKTSTDVIRNSTKMFKIAIKGITPGDVTLTFPSFVIKDDNGVMNCTIPSKQIKVIPPLSTNALLKSLTIQGFSFTPSFNSEVYSYTLNVASDITTVNITGVAEDAGATVSGGGAKPLTYGKNDFVITVTASSGTTKKYNILINRADNQTSDNYLKSLVSDSGTLSPGFNKEVFEYSMDVAYEISAINFTALANNTNSTITVKDNTNLEPGKVNPVSIEVKAPNGSVRTYKVNVTRAQDPTKVLAKNNYLETLTPSTGILSPKFHKEQLEYVIYLPYEVEEITFQTKLSDLEFASINVAGANKLKLGKNTFNIVVMAEDKTTRTYIVDVYRGMNVLTANNNTNLKQIIIKNGKLTTGFDAKKKSYIYTGKNITVEALPEEDNATVNILKSGTDYYITVTSTKGEIGVYHLSMATTNTKHTVFMVFSGLLFLSSIGLAFYVANKTNISIPPFNYIIKAYKKGQK